MRHGLPRPFFLGLLSLTTSLASPQIHAQSLDWSVAANYADQSFGRSCAIVGDVDGDGFDDVMVGEPEGSPTIFHDGQARVFSGADGSEIHSLAGVQALIGMGYDGTGLGDLNGDGYDDFAMAFIEDSPVVYSGFDASVLYQAPPTAGYASSLAGEADFNADGFRDLVVGSPLLGGQVTVISGAYMAQSSGNEVLYSWDGPASSGSFGADVDTVDDLNGDGVPDVIVGAPYFAGVDLIGAYDGMIRIYSGATGSFVREIRWYDDGAAFGAGVAGVEDQNGDGRGDVLIGARFSDENGTNSGSARLYSGADGSLLRTHLGTQAGFQLGAAVADGGDVTGDGYPDYLVSGVNDTSSGSSGTVWVYSGWNGQPAAIVGMNGGSFGSTLAAGGDFDGDAYPDFVAGAPTENYGMAYAFRGNCLGGSVPTCAGAPNSYSASGGSLASAGSYSLSTGGMSLLARQVPPGQFGVFFYGVVPALTPYGDGFVCTAGGFYRLLPAVPISAQGIATLNVDYSAPPIASGPGLIQAGQTRYFQFWFRDPFGPGWTGWNYTAGRAITFCP